MKLLREEAMSAVVSLAICVAFLASFEMPSVGLVRPFAGTLILVILLGLALRSFLRVALPTRSPRPLWTAAGISLDLLTSFAFTVLVSTVLALGFLLWETYVVAVILGSCIAFDLGTLLLTVARPALPLQERPPRHRVAAAVALIVAVASILFVIFRWPNPYPSISGWDLNPALATVGWTVDHHGFSYLLIPPFPSSALVPYPASFNDFIAGYSLFLGVPPLSVFYYGVFAMLVGYAVGVFGIAYRLTGRTGSALFATLAVLYLGTVLPETVRTPFFVTIDMLGQLLFFALFLFFLDDTQSIGRRRVVVILGFAFLLYWYFYELVVLTPLVVFMLGESAGLNGPRRQVRWFRWASGMVLAGLAALILAAELLAPSLDAALSSSYPFISKLQTLATIYAPVVLVLILLHFLGRRRVPQDPPLKGFRTSYLLEYVAAYALVYLLPLSATYRVEFYFRSALAIYLATIPLPTRAELRDVLGSIRAFIRRVQAAPPLPSSPYRRVGALAVVALVVLMIVLLPLQATQPEPYMSQDEYRASLWIRDHTPADTFVVTDPGTGYIVRAFSLRNASIFFLLPDGRAPEDSSSLHPDLQSLLHDVFTSRTSARASQQILALGFREVYVVISTRTVVWAAVEASSIFDQPFNDVSPGQLLGVFSPPWFPVAFQTPTVIVLSFAA